MALDVETITSLVSLLVASLTTVMVVMGVRSYRNTGNTRLMFVVVAFVLMGLKSLFVGWNERIHVAEHHQVLIIGTFIDLSIALLFFAPFILRTPR